MFRKVLSHPVFWLILAITLSLPLVFSLIHAGYFPSHDGEWAVVRLGDMTRLLRDGQFPPRWSINLNYGYGYPLFNFTYPLPYYLGVVFYLAKFGLIGGIKALFFLSVPVSAGFMFLVGREFWRDNWKAFVGAMLYVYLPYRIVDLYARGSIGESLALALFPIIIWLLKKNKFISSAIFYAALILTHNIMAVLFTPVILAVLTSFLLAEPKKQAIRDALKYIGFLILSYALSAFFWLPAIAEKNLILLSKIPIADRALYFLKPLDLFIPKWGYGVPNNPDGFGYFLGFPLLMILGLFVFMFIVRVKKSLIPFAVLIGFFLFMLYPVSAPVWTLPLLKEINYPWTILAPLSFVLSLLSGYIIQNKLLRIASIFLVLLAILSVLPHAQPSKYLTTNDNFYLTNDATTTSSSELMPLWVQQFPSSRPKNMIELYSGEGTTQTVSANAKEMNFLVNLSKDSVVRINQIYYPGWQLFIAQTQVQPLYQNTKGVIDLSVPQGIHQVTLKWTETPLRMTANLISLAGTAITLVLLIL